MDPARERGLSNVLVVGTRGTLEPHTAGHALRDGERLAGEEIPPFAEELLAPWLKRGLREVNAVRMLAANDVAGEPVPLDGLSGALKLRLSELISPTLGGSTAGSDVAAFWRNFPRTALVGGAFGAGLGWRDDAIPGAAGSRSETAGAEHGSEVSAACHFVGGSIFRSASAWSHGVEGGFRGKRIHLLQAAAGHGRVVVVGSARCPLRGRIATSGPRSVRWTAGIRLDGVCARRRGLAWAAR